MGCALARQKSQLNVTLLLRDPYVCRDINERHVNTRYLKVSVYIPMLLIQHAAQQPSSGNKLLYCGMHPHSDLLCRTMCFPRMLWQQQAS